VARPVLRGQLVPDRRRAPDAAHRRRTGRHDAGAHLGRRGSVGADDAGAAGGLVNVAHQLGGCLGLATLVTVFAATGSDDLERDELLAHKLSAAITAGATLISLAFMVVAVLIVWPGLRRGRTRGVAPPWALTSSLLPARGRPRTATWVTGPAVPPPGAAEEGPLDLQASQRLRETGQVCLRLSRHGGSRWSALGGGSDSS